MERRFVYRNIGSPQTVEGTATTRDCRDWGRAKTGIHRILCFKEQQQDKLPQELILREAVDQIQEIILEHRNQLLKERSSDWTKWCEDHNKHKQRKLYDWVKRVEPLSGNENLTWNQETNPEGVQDRVQKAIDEWGAYGNKVLSISKGRQKGYHE